MRYLARLAIALWLNVVAFLAVGSAAFADHTSGIEGGAYAQPWVIIVITFFFAGVAGLALLWAFRAGHFSGVEDTRGRPLEVEDEQEMKAFVLETEEE
jgi:protein-S-isoprenylcysteine O-methyltransferase Ste14